MAVLPDKIQEFFDSWDEAQEQTGTAWNDFFGGDTWSAMTPAQQQAVTEYYITNEYVNSLYRNMKQWMLDLIENGLPVPGVYGVAAGETAGAFYKLSTTGDTVYPCAFNIFENGQPRSVVAKSEHFEIELVLKDYRKPNTSEVVTYPTTLQDTGITTTCAFHNEVNNKSTSVQFANPDYTGQMRFHGTRHDKKGFFTDSTQEYGAYNMTLYVGWNSGIPTHTAGSAVPNYPAGGTSFGVSTPAAEIPTDSPWDYYNDILPDIIGDLPEDVPTDVIPFYPDGYSAEDDPTEEEEVDDETGEPPETNEDLMITSPTSFVTMYVLSPAQLASFGNEMWGGFAGANVVDIAKNFFGILSDTGTCDLSSALQLITSCMVFPFNIASTGINMITGVTGLKVGSGHTTFISTENIFKLNSIVGCLSAGTCAVNPTESYGKDFRNYYNCSVTAFLPYCGTVELNPTEVMFKELTCKYLIDFLSGECCAIIVNEFGNIVACKQGQIGFSVPLSATNARRIAGNVIDQGLTLVQSIIGSAIAGARAQSTMNAAIDRAQTVQDTISARESGIANITEAATSMGTSVGKFANNLVNGTGFGAPSLSGGGGAAQILVSKQAYVQIRRSKYKIPENYPTSVGYRSAKSGLLSSFEPYVECINVDVSGIEGAEESEKSLIKQLLESGVYI